MKWEKESEYCVFAVLDYNTTIVKTGTLKECKEWARDNLVKMPSDFQSFIVAQLRWVVRRD